MAQPITFDNVVKRFELPQREPASAAEGLSVHDRLALAKEEGRSPVLTPDELIQMEYDRLASQVTPQLAGALPSRGPVDDPSRAAQAPSSPQYNPEPDAAVLAMTGPQAPPEMEKPPTLHTPEELVAGMGRPEGRQNRFSPGDVTFEPPTLSRPPVDRGEPAFAPDTGQRGGPPGWLKGIFTGIKILEGAGRGAAAAEGAQSFLGGVGRASAAGESDQMRREGHRADLAGSAARTQQVQQRTAMLPQELAWEQEAQRITNEYKQTLAQYQKMVTASIAQKMQQAPQELSISSMDVAGRTAERLARAAQIRRLIEIGKAQTPEEAQRLVEQAELYRSQQEYYRAGVPMRAAQEYYYRRQGEEAGDDERTPFGKRSADLVFSNLLAAENKLMERYRSEDRDPSSPTKGEYIYNFAKMKQDPAYKQLELLKREYEKLTGEQPETSGALPPEPDQRMVSPTRRDLQQAPSGGGLVIDPNRIRQRALQMMGGAGAR